MTYNNPTTNDFVEDDELGPKLYGYAMLAVATAIAFTDFAPYREASPYFAIAMAFFAGILISLSRGITVKTVGWIKAFRLSVNYSLFITYSLLVETLLSWSA